MIYIQKKIIPKLEHFREKFFSPVSPYKSYVITGIGLCCLLMIFAAMLLYSRYPLDAEVIVAGSVLIAVINLIVGTVVYLRERTEGETRESPPH